MSGPKIGSMCSGAGMLDEAVRAVLGGEVAWHAETEPAASRVLAHRYPGVPNLGDLTAVDWTTVEPVDVVTAGYPCQPDSLAGKGLSTDDHRWIFPDIARALGVLRPRLVVLENVAGHFVRGFRAVLGSLTELGYDTQWTLVRASDIGAPHRRERLFVVAADAGIERRVRQPGQFGGGWHAPVGSKACDHLGDADGPPAADTRNRSGHGEWSRPESGQGVTTLADAADLGHQRGRRTRDGWDGSADCGQVPPHACRDALRQQPVSDRRCGSAAESGVAGADTATHTDGDGLQSLERVKHLRRDADGRDRADITWGVYEPAIRRWEHVTGRAAPSPTEPGARGGQRLSPRFVEWMMGWPDGWVTDVPGISRNEALRICGNGVVPQQAAAALRQLLRAVAESLGGAA